jgi:hypothetical protein
VFLSFLLYYAKSLHHHSFKQNQIELQEKRHGKNVKSAMSFGLEIVGFGAKRQKVRDNLSMRRFRSHFGIGPGVIVAIIADTKNDIELKHLSTILFSQIVQDRACHVRKMGVW